jgi:type IX secretion system PorP/SprF family membrane protein
MRNLILTIFILLNITSYSQQTTQFTQYTYNYFAYNPAVAGSQDCFNFKLGYRTQWVGIEGNPQTGFASFQTRIKFKKTRINRTYHGVGVYVENDVLGYIGTTTINLAYAYHFPMGRNIRASIGLFAGLQQFKVDASKIVTVNYNDPVLQNGGTALFVPYVTPGIFLNHDNWFAGLAIRQIVRNKWSKTIGVDARNRFHYSIVGGKRYKIGKGFNLVPSAMLKYVGFSAPALDVNLMVELSKVIEIGATWRSQDAIAIMAKFKFARFFSVGYAFDFTTSKLRTVSSNSHELIIGISACPHDKNNTYICPVFD